MGSISHLYIDSFPIFYASKGYYEDIVNLIFLESDFKKFERHFKDRNKVVWGDSYENEDGLEEIRAFYSTAQICKERLELFGASYDKAKLDFENAFQELKVEDIYDFTKLKSISYETYLKEIKKNLGSGKMKIDLNYYKDFSDYLLEYDFIIENQKLELALWSIFYVLEPEAVIEYDLTDIIEAGWTSDCPSDLINTEKIIVLTEGKTDTEFLKSCLKIFFPYLEGFYHFMDFENSKYEASASRLVHSIKSFVGSGIKNKIVGIFDNDSAALKEIKNLNKVKLPDNIRILQYPVIEFAKDYPTIGPSGIQKMNINGFAGSIEMYLGRDCLIENDNFIPIQWTGYIESIQKYQGVILNKEMLQKKFRKKVKEFDKNDYNKEDWKELISIIELMNNAWK